MRKDRIHQSSIIVLVLVINGIESGQSIRLPTTTVCALENSEARGFVSLSDRGVNKSKERKRRILLSAPLDILRCPDVHQMTQVLVPETGPWVIGSGHVDAATSASQEAWEVVFNKVACRINEVDKITFTHERSGFRKVREG